MPMSGKPRCRPYCWSQNKNGPPLFARIGIMRAINRHVEPCLTRPSKSSIGDRGNWREISDGHCVADNLRKQVDEKRGSGTTSN